MRKAVFRLSFYFVVAVVVAFAFGTSDAAAQGITDCKACGITCTPNYCIQSCVRVSYSDCRNYGMQCAGLCYTYYSYTYSDYQCRVDPSWYPCYA